MSREGKSTSCQARYKGRVRPTLLLLFATNDMQVLSTASSANSHPHSQLPVSALSIKAIPIRYVQGTEDNVEDLLSSDLEISFTSSMSLNSSLPGPVKLVDNVCREDVVPMDISPEPSRVVHQSRIASGHFLEKATRARAFTTSMRLFGRDLSNGTHISPAPSLCESGSTVASYVRVVSNQTQSRNHLRG